MKVGVVKEIKADEYRVALTPAGARELVQRGHDVLVETGAGDGSSFPDDAYRAVGAELGSVDKVWGDAELLLKVKEPLVSEYPLLWEGLVLFTEGRTSHQSSPSSEVVLRLGEHEALRLENLREVAAAERHVEDERVRRDVGHVLDDHADRADRRIVRKELVSGGSE